MATNYTKIYNDLTLTECELYEYLNTNKGFCCEKGWKWENDATGVVKTGREWKKYWQTSPPDCSGCTSPFVIVRPLIIGDPLVGNSLSVDNGTWGGTLPITYSYQWYANGTPILGATNDNLDLVSNYLGQTIKCEVTALNICGSASSDSNNVTVVSAPINTIANSISGNNYEGEVLTTTNGTWSGTATITYSYQWYRGSTPIGTNSSTYTQVSADAGYDIKCAVTATNSYGSAVANSNLIFSVPLAYQAVLAKNLSLGGTNPSAQTQRYHSLAYLAAVASGAVADAGYILCTQHDGSESFGTINWKDVNGTLAVLNNGTHIPNVGYKGNGSNAWIYTGYNPSTDTNATTTSCSFGFYGDDDFAIRGLQGGMIFGAVDAGGSRQFYMLNSASTAIWSGQISSGTLRTTTSKVKTANAYGISYDGTNVSIHVGNDVQTFAQATGQTKVNQRVGVLARKTVASQDQYTCATVGWVIGGNATAFSKWKAVLATYYPLIRPAKPTYTLQGLYDFGDLNTLFTDLAKTTLAGVGAGARVAANKVSGSIFGDLIAASAGASPTVLIPTLNSKNVVQFDGVNDNYDLPSAINGDFAAIFVVKNQDSANGSHIMYGTNYAPITGSGYVGNVTFGGEYVTIHAQVGGVGGIKLKNQGNTWNVLCIARYGTQFWTVNGLGQQNNGTNGTTFEWTKIGQEFLANWQAYIQLAKVAIYLGKPPDSVLEAAIFSEGTTFNI